MASEHQRPLVAYFLLCIAVAFLLTQGVLGNTGPALDRAISHAGQPAAQLFQSTTLTVLDRVGLLPEQEAVTPSAPVQVSVPATSSRPPAAAHHSSAPAAKAHGSRQQSHSPKVDRPGKSRAHSSSGSARVASSKAHGGGKAHGKRR